MSRKTEPRSPARRNGDCTSCRGSGRIGMYQEACTSCDGTGYADKIYPRPPLPLKDEVNLPPKTLLEEDLR